MLTKNHTYPIFFQLLFGVVFILAFGLYLFIRGMKEKEDFIHSKGQVIYYADNFPEISRPDGKYKYLLVDSYNRVFELYIPEKQTDNYTFRHDAIKIGDVIDLYFDENSFQSDKRTNRSMRFMYKNGEIIFISNPNDKTAGIGFISFGTVFTIILIVLKLKGKIE